MHREFLSCMYKGFSTDGPQLTVDMILEVTQLCCFPFAVDIAEDLSLEVQQCLHDTLVLPRIFYACTKYLQLDQLETPIGLLARLVLGNQMFVEQFAQSIKDFKTIPFLSNCVQLSSPLSVLCDVISMCGHLIRLEPDNLTMVKSVFLGIKGDFEPLNILLSHHSAAVRSRICSLIGNLLKHNNHFYSTLKQKDKIYIALTKCLKDEDPNVRKGAMYAVGNAAFHSSELYMKLKPVVPTVVELLRDPMAKTRANAASACGNFGIHSNVLVPDLKKSKVIIRLLDLACHEQQQTVQISAILALRSLSKLDELRKEMLANNAVDKLNNVTVANTPRPSSSIVTHSNIVQVNRSIQSSHGQGNTNVHTHCSKLVKILQGKT